MAMVTSAIFARNDSCPTRDIGDGVVIMAPDGSVTHSLDELSAFIWRHLDGQTDLAAISQAIVETYEVEPAAATDDLAEFLASLLQAQVIRQID